MTNILLVDDEPVILDALAHNFRQEGFSVQTAADGVQAIEAFDQFKPDMVVLDIRLPEIDGLEVCRRLRSRSPVPIIMLTALNSELDRVVGLELGADDYIAKPFSFRELLARVRALLRRVELDRSSALPGAMQVGRLSADPISRRVFKGASELQLSAREFDLLTMLMAHAGRAISREDLISKIWGSDWSGDPRTLEVHIRWLRLKIEDDPTVPRYVQTVRGYGYRFIGAAELD